MIGPGSPNDVYRLDTALAQRGRELGLVRVTNEHAAVAGLSCELAVFRVKGAGRAEPNPLNFEGRRWTGREWWNRWKAILLAAKREPGKKLIYTVLNECFDVEHITFWVAFYIELMIAASEDGVTITVGNFASASFDARHVAVLVPLAREAARRGHYMSGNVYWWDEDGENRFRYLRALMDAVPEARWVIEELGWARNDASYQGYLNLKMLINRWRATYPDVDAALWAFNGSGGGWPHSQIPVEDAVAAIAAG